MLYTYMHTHNKIMCKYYYTTKTTQLALIRNQRDVLQIFAPWFFGFICLCPSDSILIALLRTKPTSLFFRVPTTRINSPTSQLTSAITNVSHSVSSHLYFRQLYNVVCLLQTKFLHSKLIQLFHRWR